MKLTPLLSLGTAGCLALCLPAHAAETGQAAIAIPRMDADIELDGHLRDGAWTEAARHDANEEVRDREGTGTLLPPGYQTHIFLWRDADALYLGFRCENPDVPTFLKAQTRPRDGQVYSDECVEIFIRTPTGTPATRQFVFNALGNRYDGTWGGSISKDWDSDWEVATVIVRAAWYAEVRIPLADLGDNPDHVLINCARQIYSRDGTRRLSAWKAPGWFTPRFSIDLTTE